MEEFLNFKNEFPSSELINLCEIALINFFKPCKNVQHVKGDFQHISTNKFDSIHKKYDGLIIELDCDNYKLEITTDHRTFTSDKRFIQCRFNSDFKVGEYSMNDIFLNYDNNK